MSEIYARVLTAAQKAAEGLPTQPLADVVASHSATHWRGHSSRPSVTLPDGVTWDTPVARLHGGKNGKRPIYLVGGRHLASGTHFGLQSMFQFVRAMTPDEPETNVRYYLRPFAERLLPTADLLRLGF